MSHQDTNIMDHIEQAQQPTYMVPRRTTMPLLEDVGKRILAAADGFWYERKTPWMHLRTKIAHQTSVTLPYGNLTKHVSFGFVEFPAVQLEIFERSLRNKTNSDAAVAWVTWSKQHGFEYFDITLEDIPFGEKSYQQVVEDQSRWLVMEMQFGMNVKPTNAALLQLNSGGGYFVARYLFGAGGEIEKQIDLHVESMIFPIEDVVSQMAEQEFLGNHQENAA